MSVETLVPQEEPILQVETEEPPAQEEEPPIVEEAPAPPAVEEVTAAAAPKQRGRPRKDPAAPAPNKAVRIKPPTTTHS